MKDDSSAISQKMVIFTRLLAFLMLCLAAYLLIRGDSAGGAVAGAIAFGLAVLQYVPFVSEISGFGVTAKLQREVRQAEQLLEEMRAFALAFAKSTFHNMAWMNRMGEPSLEAIQEQVNSLDKLLSGLKVPDHEREQAKKPFLMMVGFDIYLVLNNLVASLLRRYQNEVQQRIQAHTAGKSISAGDSIYESLLAEKRKYDLSAFKIRPDEFYRIERLPDELRTFLSQRGISQDEIQKVVSEATSAMEIFQRCIEAGNRTKEAQEYLEKYRTSDLLFKEVFNDKSQKDAKR